METMDNSDIRIAAEQGLQKLIAGNHRFMQGQANFPTVCKEALAELAREQKPFATILGCSDSRVPPELIFDANFGELFIVRVAGQCGLAGGDGQFAVRGSASPYAPFCCTRARRMRRRESGAGI